MQNLIANQTEQDMADSFNRMLAQLELVIAKPEAALTQEEKNIKQRILLNAVLQEQSDTLRAEVKIKGIDYQVLKKTFLDNISKTNSKYTKKGYTASLYRLDVWTLKQGLNPLMLTPAQADDFIYSLKADGRASASIRLDTAVCSSFYTFAHRRHTTIENPFRGTKARPVKKAEKIPEIPNVSEIQVIITALPPMEATAVMIMARRGLRIGALCDLEIRGNNYYTTSKGKSIQGTFSEEVIQAIKGAGLNQKKPFNKIDIESVRNRIAYTIRKLKQDGTISADFSCHDFRHFFAITEYEKDHDIHRLKGLLDHASIQVTETYLKSLKVTL